MADKKKTHDVFETALDNPDDYDRARSEANEIQMREHRRKDEHDQKFQHDPTLSPKQLKVRNAPEGQRQYDDARLGALGGLAAFVGQRALRRVIRGKPKVYSEATFVTAPSTVATGAYYNWARGTENRRAEHRKKNKSKYEK